MGCSLIRMCASANCYQKQAAASNMCSIWVTIGGMLFFWRRKRLNLTSSLRKRAVILN